MRKVVKSWAQQCGEERVEKRNLSKNVLGNGIYTAVQIQIVRRLKYTYKEKDVEDGRLLVDWR